MSEDRPPIVVVTADRDAGATYDRWLDGYEVRVATSTDETVGAVDRNVDLVLLDPTVVAPVEEVIRALREASSALRIVQLADEEQAFDVVESGFDDYVVPTNGAALRTAVDDVLATHEVAERIEERGTTVAEGEAPDETDAELTGEPGDAAVDDPDERDRATDDAAFVATLREVAGGDESVSEPDAGTDEDDETEGEAGNE